MTFSLPCNIDTNTTGYVLFCFVFSKQIFLDWQVYMPNDDESLEPLDDRYNVYNSEEVEISVVFMLC